MTAVPLRLLRLGACLLAFLASAPAARAADVEIFGGFVVLSPLISRTYDASYTPSRVSGITQLFETPDPRSSARQSVFLDGATGTGFGLGVAVYPHHAFGLQLLLERTRSDLAGRNSPHTVDLVWDSVDFPSSTPVVRRASFGFDAADTAGRLKTLTLSLDGAARWKSGSVVSGSVSAGVSYFRVQATDLGVGAMAGWLGGHFVLFSELFQASLSTEAADVFGLNVGGDVAVALGSKLALFADGRFFHAPAAPASVRLDGFVGETITSVPLAQLERYLALEPVELDPRHFRVLVGFKWRP